MARIHSNPPFYGSSSSNSPWLNQQRQGARRCSMAGGNQDFKARGRSSFRSSSLLSAAWKVLGVTRWVQCWEVSIGVHQCGYTPIKKNGLEWNILYTYIYLDSPNALFFCFFKKKRFWTKKPLFVYCTFFGVLEDNPLSMGKTGQMESQGINILSGAKVWRAVTTRIIHHCLWVDQTAFQLTLISWLWWYGLETQKRKLSVDWYLHVRIKWTCCAGSLLTSQYSAI